MELDPPTHWLLTSAIINTRFQDLAEQVQPVSSLGGVLTAQLKMTMVRGTYHVYTQQESPQTNSHRTD